MSFKHIFVHLDHSRQGQTRLEFAIGLARHHQAFLSGCYASEESERRPENQAQTQQMFLEQTLNYSLSAEWLCLEAVESSQALIIQFSRRAQCADLIIVGQHDPKNDSGVPRELAEKLVLYAGRPILILPYAGNFDPHCKRVMVAWNAGRESVRALHDALPFLKQARQVNLLSLLSAGGNASELETSRALIYKHLTHHGIQAHPETQVCTEISKGDMLLNRSAEEGTGLLVAGGYYQGRLGKVARHLLKHMTAPVLMSH